LQNEFIDPIRIEQSNIYEKDNGIEFKNLNDGFNKTVMNF
jgi:hypothetical protein